MKIKMLACCRQFWDKVNAADVPVFTIVAWDALAPSAVRNWIEEAETAGVNPDKIRRAEQHLAAIEAWQDSNPNQVKIPD